MNAIRLRFILAGCIALLLIGLVAALWFLEQFLRQQVSTTDRAKIDADISQQEVATFQRLEAELADKKDIIARTKQIAASAEAYGYQDQVISDLTAYAARNGIGISSFDFKAAPGAKPGAAPTDKTAFVVNLSSPIKYQAFLAFLHDMEQNLTKIQVTSVTLSPNPKDTSEIQNPTLSLEVFLKK